MKPRRPLGLVIVAILSLLFGYLCLNYTKHDGWEHHTRQAEQYRLPPPSEPIRLIGVVAIAIGAGLVGFAAARVRQPPS